MIPYNQNRMRVGVEIGKQLGVDPDTQVCPRHPNKISPEGIRRIILKPFKVYRTVKGKQVLDSMGVSCSECGYTREIDKSQDKNIVIPSEEAENTVKTDIKLSPTG